LDCRVRVKPGNDEDVGWFGFRLEHFQQKWEPVLRQKMRQNNDLERVR
jgi:hypothetical protein